MLLDAVPHGLDTTVHPSMMDHQARTLHYHLQVHRFRFGMPPGDRHLDPRSSSSMMQTCDEGVAIAPSVAPKEGPLIGLPTVILRPVAHPMAPIHPLSLSLWQLICPQAICGHA